MIPNSDTILCPGGQRQLTPLSTLLKLDIVPFSFHRQTHNCIYYTDVRDNLVTNIMELSFNSKGETHLKEIEEFMGVYEYCCFGDEHAFLVNREGDIIYYDIVDKNSFFVEKQHPSPFSPLQVHNIGEHFITCGGNIVSNFNENEKIIKLWQYEQEQLISKARINTGHTKAIQNSLVMGTNRIVTMANDNSLRVANLATQQLDQVIKTNKYYYSGCQVDWNTVLVGGLGKSLDILDLRSKRLIYSHELHIPVLQICEITRLSANQILFANVNHLYSLDIRTFQITERGIYDGERISKIQAINGDCLILGNRDKTMQLWHFV